MLCVSLYLLYLFQSVVSLSLLLLISDVRYIIYTYQISFYLLYRKSWEIVFFLALAVNLRSLFLMSTCTQVMLMLQSGDRIAPSLKLAQSN